MAKTPYANYPGSTSGSGGVDKYQQMWEAWVSGTGWGTGTALDPKRTESIGQQRIVDFYNEIVGPAFGGGEGFGDVYKDYLVTGGGAEGWTSEQMERAEREFRMAIGDPYV